MKNLRPLECSHRESGACDPCKRPFAEKEVGRVPTIRHASIRKDTKLAPRTDRVLKFFMLANEPERSRLRYLARGGKTITTRNYLFT